MLDYVLQVRIPAAPPAEVTADAGAFAVTGADATLAYSSAGASITIDTIGPQASDTGAVPFEYTLSADDTPEFLLVRSSASNPVSGDFNGGQTGPDVFDVGSQALTAAGSTGTMSTGPNGINGDFRLWALTTGSTTPVSSAVVTIDSRSVVLSSPTGTQTGQTTADGSVSADRAFGTLYAGVWPTSAPPANDAAIEAGTGATYHTSVSTAAGANAFSATGLTAATDYRWHFVVRYPSDQLGTSAQSATFTTASASGGYTDSFAYTNGTDLSTQSPYSAGTNDSGTDNLVVTSGSVAQDGTDGVGAVSTVTRADDPGSDDTFIELDWTPTRATASNATRLRVWIGDIEFRIAAEGTLAIRQAGSSVAGGAFSEVVGTEYTARCEYNRGAGSVRILIDGSEQSAATSLTLPADRTFEWGIQISSSDQKADIEISEVRTGVI